MEEQRPLAVIETTNGTIKMTMAADRQVNEQEWQSFSEWLAGALAQAARGESVAT
ncbi:UNVERIFIED_CONTAM: hypothetical protein ABID98_000444 [Brevibacillus sp. OAP136]|uniref:hypothetical protein n=1 Tax=Brevibacillus fluminis TaxID=511487 RepID=UPI0016065E76|nr:hypothetical protein [Brevibacillus fluminis]